MIWVLTKTYHHLFGLRTVNVHIIASWPIAYYVAESWRLLVELTVHISKIEQSSTYLYMVQGVRRSLIWMQKSLGPDTVPCGTPPLGLSHCEHMSPIFTLWVRWTKNAATHLTIWRCTPEFSNLSNKIKWLISWSNQLVVLWRKFAVSSLIPLMGHSYQSICSACSRNPPTPELIVIYDISYFSVDPFSPLLW